MGILASLSRLTRKEREMELCSQRRKGNRMHLWGCLHTLSILTAKTAICFLSMFQLTLSKGFCLYPCLPKLYFPLLLDIYYNM